MNPNPEFKTHWCGPFKTLLAVQAGVLLLCLAAATSPAQTYTVLHSFGTNVMGLYPHAPLVQGPDGMLYGTTEQGGSANQGQVFKVNPDGSDYTVLKDFTGMDGANPEAGLVVSGTTLYGTTAGGGTNYNGTVFKVNTDGSGFVVLHNLAGYPMDGAYPYSALILSGTTLYGTTANGGSFDNGTVFKVNTDGTGCAVLKNFTGSFDGEWPYACLTASGATLYGTANGGGSYGDGTVFRINTDGSGFTVLKSFTGGRDGGGPGAGLVLSGASLYGTASWGGNSGNGTVFEINTNGSGFSVLKDFTDYSEGANPYSDLLVSGTTLYGTAVNGGSSGNGTMFKVNTDGSGFAVLKDFTNSTDGAYSYAGLLLSGTTLFGTTYNGGNSGYGVVFKVETDGSAYTVITHFAGGDGVNPYGNLVLSGDTFYGTTAGGGAAGNGTVFKINTDGSGYTVLKDFINGLDGANPNGSMVLSGTTLFGTANGGSSWNGVLFKVNTDGSGYTVLKDFTNSVDGANPNGSMVLSGTTLYGTTSGGGSYGYGAVFKINIDGTGFDLLYSFSTLGWSGSASTNADGAWPQAGLILSGSTLFGTTAGGGTEGVGAVFKVNTDGSGFTVLKDFVGTYGANPQGILVLSDTTLYGVASWGGSSGDGTIFKVTTDGSGFTVLKNFTGSDGGGPIGNLILSDTTLYGTTANGGIMGKGTVFQVNTDGSDFTVLKHFTGSDGTYPQTGLVLSGTTLYGTTVNGGGLDSGVLFSLSLLPGAPQIQLQPQSQIVEVNSSASLLVVASGIPTPVYQWFFNGDAVDGATNYSIQFTNIQSSQAGDYTVVITNIYGSVTSLVANLTLQDPFINGWTSSAGVNAGGTVSFAVDAGGTAPLNFQWFKGGVSLSDGETISGAHTATLTVTNVNGGDTGWYFCVVTNTSGSVTGPTDLLSVKDPFINSQPSDQLENAGDTVEFSVDAGGTPPLSYQWFKDGVNLNDSGSISGAQTSMLTLSNVVRTDAGGCSVVISNAYGTISSTVAQLTVNLATLDPIDPGADGGVICLAVQADGKILVGGWFRSLGELGRSYLGRLNADGTSDATFDPAADNEVDCLALEADSKILVGGWFATLGGQTRSYLGRLNADGTLDTTFNSATGIPVHCLAVQPDGKILVGEFSKGDGQTRDYLERLNADGTLDTNFNCGADGTVHCVALQADEKIIVGGEFNTLAGQTRYHIARLNADGTMDSTFDPGASDWVGSLVVQADGKILVGGGFNMLGGQTRYHIGRLNADGTLDASFNPEADYDVVSMALQADGRILVGGQFNMLAGQTRYYLGRLNADGTLDNTFSPWTDGGINTLTVQPDGKILVGGDFGMLAGQTRNHLGRLNNTEPATEDLTFDGSTVTWLRGGSSPEVWRTSFAMSTNGTDWLQLGIGTRIAGGWQLTGLSAPTNGTLRAIGFIAGYGVSTWFVETMTGPPAITVQPQNVSCNLEATAVFTVQAGGTPPLGYQWFKGGVNLTDGENISGAQTATLTLSNVSGGDAGGYSVVITNASGSVTSLVATLNVEDPFISTQPISQSGNAGDTVQFSVDAGGTPPLNYRWLKDGVGLNDGGNISGVRTRTLAVSSILGGDAGSYSVIVSNAYGNVTSVVAMLTISGDPSIVTQPVSQRVDVGQPAAFSVGAGGSAPFEYQWRKGGAALPGATNALLTIDPARIANEGFYDVMVSNQFGQVTSAAAELVLNMMVLDSFNPALSPLLGLTCRAQALAVQPDGKILVAGRFIPPGGQTSSALVRLNPDGTLDTTFAPMPDGYVYDLVLQPDGKIIVGGYFWMAQGGQTRSCLAKLDANGSLDPTFNCSADRVVYCLALQPDGKVLVGGDFAYLGGQDRVCIARLNPDGALDASFNPGCTNSVFRLAVQSDGKILVAGSFWWLAGQHCNNLGRLNPDGTLDTTFAPSIFNSVYWLALQPDDKVLVGNGMNFMRLNPDGTWDYGFNPLLNNPVSCSTFQPDGKILIGGMFTTAGGALHEYIARLLPNGDVDSAFSAGANNWVQCVLWQPDGSILVAGDFTELCGQPRNYVGRLLECSAPSLSTPLQSQTAEAGKSTSLTIGTSGCPSPVCRWFFGTNMLMSEINACLQLTNIQFDQAGIYTVVLSNIAGVVTSSPVCLQVIPAVDRRPVAGIALTGEPGALLNVEYANALGTAANWLPLDTMNLTNPPQYCFDPTTPRPPQRFYRAWQTGTPTLVPSLNLTFVPAVTLAGSVGDSLRLDCINQFGPTDAWVTLDTVTLTNTSQLYFDVSAVGQPLRLYRIVPAP